MELHYFLRPMKKEDVPQVVEIEKKSFPTPWSSYAFSCELADNEFAYYLIVTTEENPAEVLGYGGMWIILDEVHITNIAITPAYRGKRLGEFLMKGMFALALRKGASRMTLEVRVSNQRAQRLYTKLGFTVAGIRPGYYSDTNEDALIMWKELLEKEILE
ncbi:MAG: ribosomal protein S18-alanine N-acetyltransferase [Peptococcia bacterium]|jgi:ribosomal-protein-alanine N-acetyltransferase